MVTGWLAYAAAAASPAVVPDPPRSPPSVPPRARAPPVGADTARFVSCRVSTLILNAGAPGDAWPDFQDQYFPAHAGGPSTPFIVLFATDTRKCFADLTLWPESRSVI